MKKIAKAALLGAALGFTVFVLMGVVMDIVFSGELAFPNWTYSKMAAGALVVGLGFSLPSLVYESERLATWAKVLIHMGTGCIVMLAAALLVGWIPLQAGWKICLLAVACALLAAFLIWLIMTLYYRSLASRMNERIKSGQKE